MRKAKRFDPGIILVGVIVVIVFSVAVFLYFQVRTDPVSEYIEAQKIIPVALIISDGDKIVVSELVLYHPSTHRSAVIDVPPNTSVLIESEEKFDRIDALFQPGKLERYLKTMEDLLGTEIPFYINIPIEELKNFISILGGIEIFIATPIEQISEENIVLLPSGRNTLDGTKTTMFLTYTDEADTEAEIIGRKQKFVQALLKEIGEQAIMIGKKNVFSVLSRYFSSNLNKQALLSLFEAYASLDPDLSTLMRTLGATRNVGDTALLFPHRDAAIIKETTTQAINSLSAVDEVGNVGSAIVLEILNGTGISGLASRTAQLYQSYGYDVDIVGNADSDDFDKTLIFDRTGNIGLAQKAASVINCQRIETDIYLENTGGIDVTIILGKDFDERTIKN